MQAITDREISDLHQIVRDTRTYQFEFETPQEPDSTSFRLELDFLDPIFRALEPVFVIMFWIMLAAIVCGILYAVGREIWRRSRNRRGQAETQEPGRYQPTEEFARTLLYEADRLAAEGRFDEAVHLLLFESIDDIRRRWPNAVPESLTSREISHLEVLTQASQATFRTIATFVEQTLFAGRAIDATGFRSCRLAYADFVGQRHLP